MYQIVQNMNSFNNSYEYSHEYKTIAEAEKAIVEYEAEDKTLGGYHLTHDYTIVSDGEDVGEKQNAYFREMAVAAATDVCGNEDEAEMLVSDYLLGY